MGFLRCFKAIYLGVKKKNIFLLWEKKNITFAPQKFNTFFWKKVQL